MANEWLKEDRSKPFLLMLGHKAPHSFYTPEPKYENAFDSVHISYPESAFDLQDKPRWIRQRLPLGMAFTDRFLTGATVFQILPQKP